MKRISFIVLAFAFLFCTGYAQVFPFANYSVKEGLAQSSVTAIIQDDNANIWLGTEGGLSRFDGKTFYNYTSQDGLADNTIRCLLFDSKKNIWIGHSSGAVTLMNKGEFKTLLKDVIPANKKVRFIYEDKSAAIWISVEDFGIIKINNPNSDLNNPDNYKLFKSADGLSSYVFDMLESQSGIYYFTTDAGIKEYNPKTNTFTFLKIPQLNGLQFPKILEDKKGNLWLSAYMGGPGMLVCYNVKTQQKEEYSSPSWITNISEDKHGNIWATTWGNGLFYVSPLAGENNVKLFNAENGLAATKIYTSYFDREGNLLVGAHHNGLFIFKGERFACYTNASGLPSEQVNALLTLNNKNILIGTANGIATLDIKNNSISPLPFKPVAPDVRAFARDKNGDIWIATANCKILKYNSKTNQLVTAVNLNNNLSSTFITSLAIDHQNKLWIATSGSGLSVYNINNETYKDITAEDGFYGQELTINTLMCDSKGIIWISVDGKGIAKYSNGKFELFSKNGTWDKSNIITIAEDSNGAMWFGTGGDGLYQYHSGKFTHYTTANGLKSGYINLLLADRNNDLWIGTNKGLSRYNKNTNNFISYGKNEGFTSIETKPNAITAGASGVLWIGTVNGLVKYNGQFDYSDSLEALTTIYDIELNYKEHLRPDKFIELSHSQKTLRFSYSGIYISNPDEVKYEVMLEGADATWRPSTQETSVIYSNLTPGNYIFKVRTCNNLGIWNKQPVTFAFKINPPWYASWWAILIYVSIIIISVYSYIRWREKKLVAEKNKLETKVKERTAEVLEKNKELDEKNRDILASIRYAKRIQDAVLPPDDYIREKFPQTFILYKPKDIVSGDFYWVNKKDNKILFAAVDCTGHGVPGAFMSLVGYNHLEQIVAEQHIVEPAAILNLLNKNVSETLRQSSADDNVKDGMDIALCMFDNVTKELQYAGAFNPLYLIRNKELTEIKANKFPIGNLKLNEKLNFTNHSIQLQKGDTIYIFSDGYADQFGGPNGKKLKYGVFKQMLLDIQHLSMDEQGEFLTNAIEQWRGAHEQVDDILVIGSRL